MKPSIGRIVRYNSNHGPAAAIVIRVHSVGDGSIVDLQVFRQDGSIRHCTDVEPGKHLGGWQWPPRE